MTSPPTDSELLDRVRSSDRDAFRTLFERYQPYLFRQTLFMVGDPDLSHDIVQETFVKVWLHRRTLRSGLSLLGYMLKISNNLVRDQGRHREVRTKLSSALPPPAKSEGDDPAETLDLRILEDRISVIIRRHLSDRCRQIFLLSRFEGKSQREIADLLGIRVKTVENQMNKSLKVLREKLGRG